jgi:hypothetical protein
MPFSKPLLNEIYTNDETINTLPHATIGIDVFNQGQQILISANTSLETREEIDKKQPGILDDYPI